MLESVDDLSPTRLETMKVEDLTTGSLHLCGLYKRFKDEIMDVNLRTDSELAGESKRKDAFTEASLKYRDE